MLLSECFLSQEQKINCLIREGQKQKIALFSRIFCSPEKQNKTRIQTYLLGNKQCSAWKRSGGREGVILWKTVTDLVTTRCGITQLLSPGLKAWKSLKGPALKGRASMKGKGWYDPGLRAMNERWYKRSVQASMVRDSRPYYADILFVI